MAQIEAKGGRFLSSVTASNTQGEVVAAWEVVGKQATKRKVQQALRDAALNSLPGAEEEGGSLHSSHSSQMSQGHDTSVSRSEGGKASAQAQVAQLLANQELQIRHQLGHVEQLPPLGTMVSAYEALQPPSGPYISVSKPTHHPTRPELGGIFLQQQQLALGQALQQLGDSLSSQALSGMAQTRNLLLPHHRSALPGLGAGVSQANMSGQGTARPNLGSTETTANLEERASKKNHEVEVEEEEQQKPAAIVGRFPPSQPFTRNALQGLSSVGQHHLFASTHPVLLTENAASLNQHMAPSTVQQISGTQISTEDQLPLDHRRHDSDSTMFSSILSFRLSDDSDGDSRHDATKSAPPSSSASVDSSSEEAE